jgi:thioredoxin-related protein
MSKVNAESDEKTTYKGKEYSYRQLTAGFGITGFPATIFLSPDGEFITNVSGYITAEKFMPMLEYIDGKHYENMEYEEFLAKREAK